MTHAFGQYNANTYAGLLSKLATAGIYESKSINIRIAAMSISTAFWYAFSLWLSLWQTSN
jgi:hypothetical protein